MRIWAKAMKGGKIRKQFVYERDGKVVYSQFFTYLSEICAALDVPTPVLLKTHIFNFAKFNHVNFLPRDFVEASPTINWCWKISFNPPASVPAGFPGGQSRFGGAPRKINFLQKPRFFLDKSPISGYNTSTVKTE